MLTSEDVPREEFCSLSVLAGKLRANQQVIALLGGVGLLNVAVWVATIIAFRHYPMLLGTGFLAYGFGLRHAVDADHIAAIDNVTRKLLQEQKQPLGAGLFFSLGHSTIVFALSAVVAATAMAVRTRFGAVESFGNVAGTLVSALFLFAIAAANIVILGAVFRTFSLVKAGGRLDVAELDVLLAKRGFLNRIFRRVFGLVNESWQMYPVGLLFGLGFDTATEIGLLGIAAAAASKGLAVWTILIFPALFTAGMALIDTADSVLMIGAYGWAFTRPLRKLYYNITITSVSVLIALLVGGVELLGMLRSELNLSGRFWNAVAGANGNFGLLGYAIIFIFLGSWVGSVLFYRWRQYDRIELNNMD